MCIRDRIKDKGRKSSTKRRGKKSSRFEDTRRASRDSRQVATEMKTDVAASLDQAVQLPDSLTVQELSLIHI